ncbi:hypothetical protein C0J52_26897 [Blattella germanica]|nr:hypothetical protein C0J52_26897 [Blattella germanica]
MELNILHSHLLGTGSHLLLQHQMQLSPFLQMQLNTNNHRHLNTPINHIRMDIHNLLQMQLSTNNHPHPLHPNIPTNHMIMDIHNLLQGIHTILSIRGTMPPYNRRTTAVAKQ